MFRVRFETVGESFGSEKFDAGEAFRADCAKVVVVLKGVLHREIDVLRRKMGAVREALHPRLNGTEMELEFSGPLHLTLIIL